MPHYKLVSSGRPEIQADEIILSRDENGEVEHSLSLRRAREIPEELLSEAQHLAGKLGFKVIEAEPPPEEEEERQPVGADTAGQAQVSGGSAGGALDAGTSATAGSGTPGTSETTTGGPSPSNT